MKEFKVVHWSKLQIFGDRRNYLLFGKASRVTREPEGKKANAEKRGKKGAGNGY